MAIPCSTAATKIQPEFSRPVRIDTLGEGGRTVAIEADEAERAALAARFGLISIEGLAADAVLRREGETILAEGRIRATVERISLRHRRNDGALFESVLEHEVVFRHEATQTHRHTAHCDWLTHGGGSMCGQAT